MKASPKPIFPLFSGDLRRKAALFFKFSELAADIITEIIDGQVLPAIAGGNFPNRFHVLVFSVWMIQSPSPLV